MQACVTSENSFKYAGWKVVAAAFVGVMVGFAGMVPFTFSLFLDPLHASFGWKREAISQAFAVAALTVACVSPLLGIVLDRFPPRRVILPCIAVFAAAMASLSLLHGSLTQYYGTYFVLGLVGNGTAQLSYSRAVLSWFRARRGVAIALMLTGSGCGSILLPLLAQHFITHAGWRAGYLALGITAVAGLPLTALFVRNRPAAEMEHQEQGVAVHSPLGLPFVLIAVSTLLVALSINALIAHLAALLTSRGVPSNSAALALSLFGGSAIVGRLVTGWLLDRVSAPVVSFAVLALAAAGVCVEAQAASPWMGWAGAVLMGAGSGSEADVVPYLIVSYFGRRRFSTLYGLTWTAYAVGGALGPVLLGHAFDRHNAYAAAAVLALAVPCVIASLLQLLLPRAAAQSIQTAANASAAGVEPALSPIQEMSHASH